MIMFKKLYTGTVVSVLKEFDGFLVGGCVRDALMGKHSKDIDICCPYMPFEIEEQLQQSTYKWRNHGKAYGVFVIDDGEGLEIELSSMRQDLDCDGRHCVPGFTKELEFDCGRRDLTINAMALNLEEKLFDFHGGRKDLQNKVIRFVGDAVQRIDEDNLRAWRALRFSYRLNFDMEISTLKGLASYINSFYSEPILDDCLVIKENLSTFKGREGYRLSGERIQKELNSTLPSLNGRWDKYVYLCGLLQTTGLPILQSWEHPQPKRYHKYSVSEHTLQVINLVPPDLELRMAAMLHDIGKPEVAEYKADGEVTFPAHEIVSARITEEFLSSLKYPNEFIANVTRLVAEHMKVLPKSNVKKLQFFNSMGDKLYKKHVILRVADLCGKGLTEAFEYIAQSVSEAFEVMELEEEQPLELAIDGEDIMQELSCKPGPTVGKAFLLAKELVMENPSNNTREILLDSIRNKFLTNVP